MTPDFTIFGGSGFIGAALAERLRVSGRSVATPARGEPPPEPAGHVIYAVGLTGDFRDRPLDAVEAHVETLRALIGATRFESWLYLSSTRVYGGLGPEETATEESPLTVRPGADALYDLSKLLGESICLSQASPRARAARLSNVVGPGQNPHSFLGSVLAETAAAGEAEIRESPDSSKDYIALDDVVRLLPEIAVRGRHRLYNVASGTPTRHAALAEAIQAGGLRARFAAGGPVRRFPRIDITRIREEFGFAPASPREAIAAAARSFSRTQAGDSARHG